MDDFRVQEEWKITLPQERILNTNPQKRKTSVV
jgi:hypothetical protein